MMEKALEKSQTQAIVFKTDDPTEQRIIQLMNELPAFYFEKTTCRTVDDLINNNNKKDNIYSREQEVVPEPIKYEICSTTFPWCPSTIYARLEVLNILKHKVDQILASKVESRSSQLINGINNIYEFERILCENKNDVSAGKSLLKDYAKFFVQKSLRVVYLKLKRNRIFLLKKKLQEMNIYQEYIKIINLLFNDKNTNIFPQALLIFDALTRIRVSQTELGSYHCMISLTQQIHEITRIFRDRINQIVAINVMDPNLNVDSTLLNIYGTCMFMYHLLYPTSSFPAELMRQANDSIARRFRAVLLEYTNKINKNNENNENSKKIIINKLEASKTNSIKNLAKNINVDQLTECWNEMCLVVSQFINKLKILLYYNDCLLLSIITTILSNQKMHENNFTGERLDLLLAKQQPETIIDSMASIDRIITYSDSYLIEYINFVNKCREDIYRLKSQTMERINSCLISALTSMPTFFGKLEINSMFRLGGFIFLIIKMTEEFNKENIINNNIVINNKKIYSCDIPTLKNILKKLKKNDNIFFSDNITQLNTLAEFLRENKLFQCFQNLVWNFIQFLHTEKLTFIREVIERETWQRLPLTINASKFLSKMHLIEDKKICCWLRTLINGELYNICTRSNFFNNENECICINNKNSELLIKNKYEKQLEDFIPLFIEAANIKKTPKTQQVQYDSKPLNEAAELFSSRINWSEKSYNQVAMQCALQVYKTITYDNISIKKNQKNSNKKYSYAAQSSKYMISTNLDEKEKENNNELLNNSSSQEETPLIIVCCMSSKCMFDVINLYWQFVLLAPTLTFEIFVALLQLFDIYKYSIVGSFTLSFTFEMLVGELITKNNQNSKILFPDFYKIFGSKLGIISNNLNIDLINNNNIIDSDQTQTTQTTTITNTTMKKHPSHRIKQINKNISIIQENEQIPLPRGLNNYIVHTEYCYALGLSYLPELFNIEKIQSKYPTLSRLLKITKNNLLNIMQEEKSICTILPKPNEVLFSPCRLNGILEKLIACESLISILASITDSLIIYSGDKKEYINNNLFLVKPHLQAFCTIEQQTFILQQLRDRHDSCIQLRELLHEQSAIQLTCFRTLIVEEITLKIDWEINLFNNNIEENTTDNIEQILRNPKILQNKRKIIETTKHYIRYLNSLKLNLRCAGGGAIPHTSLILFWKNLYKCIASLVATFCILLPSQITNKNTNPILHNAITTILTEELKRCSQAAKEIYQDHKNNNKE